MITIMRKPFIDTVELVLQIPSPDFYAFLWAQASGVKSVQSEIVPNGKILIQKGLHLIRTKYYHASKRNTADIEVWSNKQALKFFKLRLFPQRWEAGEFEAFQGLLELLYQISYQQLYDQAKVTRLDVARDLYGVDRARLIPFRSHTTVSSVYTAPEGLGTIYLGGVTSARRFRIYNKAAQSKTVKVQWPHWTRVEAVLRHCHLRCAELAELTNPFVGFGLADRDIAYSLSDDGEWSQFLDACVSQGSPAAIHSLESKAKRVAFRKRLADCQFNWWNPESNWQYWPQALPAIVPACSTIQ